MHFVVLLSEKRRLAETLANAVAVMEGFLLLL